MPPSSSSSPSRGSSSSRRKRPFFFSFAASSRRRRILLLGAASSLLLLYCYKAFSSRSTQTGTSYDQDHKAHGWFSTISSTGDEEEGMHEWLRGCKYVYLDVGANVGIQIRKLYEPHMYPKADVLPVFDNVFGEQWNTRLGKELCAVGFEPNPHNTATLLKLETAYRQQGWRVKFFTETAVAMEDGEADFYLDEDSPAKYHEPGSSLVAHPDEPERASTRVRTVDLARYILQEVFYGELEKKKEDRPVVVMKMDVEAYEHLLLPHLIVTGAMCKLHTVMYEPHGWNYVTSQYNITDFDFTLFFDHFVRTHDHKACPVHFFDMDDESYDTTLRPLPKPPGSKTRQRRQNYGDKK